MKKIKSSKVAIFSDIHWGKTRDSIKKIEFMEQFVDWFIDYNIKNQINTVFFLGDWFDHRNSVNVNTGFRAYNSIKKLSKHFQVFMIVGNHDSYYKTTIETNSLIQYESLNNVTVVKKPLELDYKGTTMLMLPWDSDDLNKYKDKEYDFLFGHFEPSGIEINKVYKSKGSFNTKDYCELAPVVFSGHFHTHKHYNNKNGLYISVGCPLELSWNDYNNKKGFYTIDFQTKQYEFVKNNKSPIHVQYVWSKLKSGDQKLCKSKIKDNYIKLVVDDKYKYQDIMSLMDAINKCDPTSAEPDFIFSINRDLLGENDIQSAEVMQLSHIEYIIKYINGLTLPESVEKNNLVSKINQYYKQVEV